MMKKYVYVESLSGTACIEKLKKKKKDNTKNTCQQ